MQKGDTIFAWEAYEFKDRDMKADWFWALGIIALAGSVASFIWGNFLFGVFIILASIAVVHLGTQKPRRITYEITTGGVVYEGVFYPFETLHAFWLQETDPSDRKLLLRSERMFVPLLTLPFETEDQGMAIFEALDDIVPEEPLQEPWGQVIMERLGF